jgi:23S rRNA pseudouridine955/2504/2580 synthase
LPGTLAAGMMGAMMDLTVKKDEAGIPALDWLHQRLAGVPAGYLRQLLRRGQIRRSGQVLHGGEILAVGDRLELPANRRLQLLLESAPPALTILAESREALIVAKPAGLAVHRGVGHESDHLTGRVEQLLRQRRAPFRCAPIHRLDAATSGPVLFGKGRQAIAAFGRVFMNGPTSKLYLALVAGSFPATGVLDSPVPVRGRDREALTRFRLLASAGGLTLLELELLTGRRHQLRRQLADAGHPIAGDERYRGPRLAGLDRMFLHCRRLVVGNPFGAVPLAAEMALPDDLAGRLQHLGLEIDLPENEP